jgi:hypothetical protein
VTYQHQNPYQQYQPPASPPGYELPPQGYYQPQNFGSPTASPAGPPVIRPRRKPRVFLWVFVAVQALFMIWLAVGLAAKTGPSVAAQVARQCSHGGWQGLFSSQADCTRHYAVALHDATNAGKGLGAALIVIIWIVIDFFLALSYGIYRLASRPR